MKNELDLKTCLGQLIREKRKEKNYTLKELAEKVGSSEQHLSKIERGKKTYSLLFLEKMIKALEFENYKTFFSNLP